MGKLLSEGSHELFADFVLFVVDVERDPFVEAGVTADGGDVDHAVPIYSRIPNQHLQENLLPCSYKLCALFFSPPNAYFLNLSLMTPLRLPKAHT